MAEGPGHFLNELTIWKLKAVAQEFKIDVSSCRYKRDYVQKIASKKLTEEQVRAALDRISSIKAASESESEQKRISRDLRMIADAPKQPSALSEDDEKAVERHIDEALLMKPELFEVDTVVESALSKMLVGDYYSAIKLSKQARDKYLEIFSNFQVYSAAMSIRSVDELLTRLASEKGDLDPILRTALAEAKKAFIDGQPKRREESLQTLETLATKAFDAFLANSEKEEAELRGLLADYESFGTRTDEARRYLEIANQARTTMNVAEYGKLLNDARMQADRAKDLRTKEIAGAFQIVKAATAEAAAVGVETDPAEVDLAEAKKAYEQGSFKTALELLTSIEKQVDGAHLEQLRQQKGLEDRHLETVKQAVVKYDPMFQEAGGYGLDVTEGSYHIMNARAALGRRDAVNGVKFARRIRELGASTEKELDQKKLELGQIAKVEGTSCSNCGKESVYSYQDKSRKCIECGQPATTQDNRGPEPSATDKMKAEATSQTEQEAQRGDAVPPKEKKRFRLLRR
jgi:ribosomal protein L37E